MNRPVHPTLLLILSLPFFLLGAILAGINWHNLGQPEKGRNTIRNSILGTLFLLTIMLFTEREVVIKLWPVWLGINLGVGMGLRKLQFPAYEAWRAR